jgi:hypothetical protein
MAGVITFRPDTIPNRAHGAIVVELLRWLGLHTAITFRIFRLCPIEVAHDLLEFIVLVPRCNVDPAGTAIQAAWRHQILILHFLFCPTFHYSSSPFMKLKKGDGFISPSDSL